MFFLGDVGVVLCLNSSMEGYFHLPLQSLSPRGSAGTETQLIFSTSGGGQSKTAAWVVNSFVDNFVKGILHSNNDVPLRAGEDTFSFLRCKTLNTLVNCSMLLCTPGLYSLAEVPS